MSDAPIDERYEIAAELFAAHAEIESLRSRLAEREAQIKRWQDSSGCVGTFCKADILLDRSRELQARLAEADALLREAREYVEGPHYVDEYGTELEMQFDTSPALLARIDAHLSRKEGET